MKYGLYDTKCHLWLGNAKGPFLFTDEMTAKAAATICSERCDYDPIINAKPYPDGPARLKDEFKPKFTLHQALRKLGKPK